MNTNTRYVILDSETTGLNVMSDRIVELGCVEVMEDVVTGNYFQSYVNPDYLNTPGALKIHGLKDSFLKKQTRFKEVADRFLLLYMDR
ncbi:DNA polymerase III subunit epsilon [Candidatus Tremblaya phenacola]|uniref:DNA polymerase III subunit epsilon n=1 Tax=Candidatus Tremblayella phenacoccinincola TaxID=1010676 RepID=A0A2G0V6Y7_9PROT|nr:DNA polymerase III subunit epsilon [Candidatus Tremblaya phenacola]